MVLLLTATTLSCPAGEAGPGEPCPKNSAAVIGWAENVRLMEVGVEQKARIDTGADLAAIDANIIEIRRGEMPSGTDQIVFSIDDGNGGSATLERDIVDWVKIKNKGTNGSTGRPVVIMRLCIAG
ncbi:MAG TPA: RimK/LysX family protein, partial [Lamprocystis sp. (in: g-proteobacteria)]|nr:RimK/LysX family protein [Lamprocystis sp. (in: g-proteobacteria)]